MITFDKINRRAHLYLGLFLMPWLLVYGVSSFIIIHERALHVSEPLRWEPLFEKDYHRSISDQDDVRITAQEILKDCGLEGAFWANKSKGDTLEIDRFSFWDSTRLTYSIKDQRLKAEHQSSRAHQAVVRMHFRGGYGQPGFWNKFWGLLVDLACLGIIVWTVSGLIMWWRLPRFRIWGAIAAVGGLLSFLLLIWNI